MRLWDFESRKNDCKQNTNYMAKEASSAYELYSIYMCVLTLSNIICGV